jgi:hypothetical protein
MLDWKVTGIMRTSLPKTLHIGGYWRGPNDMVRQMMLGLRATQAEAYEYDTDDNPEAVDCEGRFYNRGIFGPGWPRCDLLQPLLEQFRPDLIVCNAGGLSFRPHCKVLLSPRTPEQAQEVREAGRHRALAEHTWCRAWHRIVAQLPRMGVVAC